MGRDDPQNVFCRRQGKLLLRHRLRVMWGSVVMLVLLQASCCVSQDLKKDGSTFSCAGRLAGYYADIDSGCQLYHLCDIEGRRFTHTCPNETLFQQRMMICDHWYMVDCSKAHHDYSANLLLGQRDKPFVSADEHIHRHPVKGLSPLTAPSSARRARNRNTPPSLDKYKNNIFLEKLFVTATPKSEVSENVLEVHVVDPRHMFYISEDSAPSGSDKNNTVLFIAVPSSSSGSTSRPGVMKFKNHTSETRNPSCPKCHPEYLSPGKCEPCVVIR